MSNSISGNVGIVIVSHSSKIAEGAADMVRQMVGNAVPLAWTGGDIDGGLGTNVAGILEAIETAWSPAGVAILVDLGGAETNSEMAVEMLPEDRRARVVVCNAPVVEGAVIAATESSSSVARRNSMHDANASRTAETFVPLTGSAVLVNAVGLHARPSVKLTQSAKRFTAKIELALLADGPWTDAKSPVKVMRVKAPQGATLHFRVTGPDGEAALAAMLALVHDGFGEA